LFSAKARRVSEGKNTALTLIYSSQVVANPQSLTRHYFRF
jgi:hypothetical protein